MKDEKTIILMTCRDSVQAHIIQGALENEGIPSILHNEHVVNLLPNMNNIMNLGVQILVFESDLERAMDILKQNQPPRVKYCPDCGSEDLSLGLGKKQGRKLFFAFMSGLAGTPMGNIYSIYICNQCGKEFEIPADSSAGWEDQGTDENVES